ncbi:MAG: hypothetical protein FWC67_04450 [Defluviitaleaceae bacterium]|nr:hypothetical protein [Defluviitaleaceae bacterium]
MAIKKSKVLLLAVSCVIVALAVFLLLPPSVSAEGMDADVYYLELEKHAFEEIELPPYFGGVDLLRHIPPHINEYNRARADFFKPLYDLIPFNFLQEKGFETLDEEAAALLNLYVTHYEPLFLEWDAYRREDPRRFLGMSFGTRLEGGGTWELSLERYGYKLEYSSKFTELAIQRSEEAIAQGLPIPPPLLGFTHQSSVDSNLVHRIIFFPR